MSSPIAIRIPTQDDFTEAAPVSLPLGDTVVQTRTAFHQVVPGSNSVTGVWECSVGQFKRQIAQAEYSYIVSGEGSFTPDGGAPIEFGAGDALYFPANSLGIWDVRKPIQKTYIIFN